MGIYPSIPHETGLRALREALDKQEKISITTEDLVEIAEFCKKRNILLSLTVK